MVDYIEIRLADASFLRSGMLIRISEDRSVFKILDVDYGKGRVYVKKAAWWEPAWMTVRRILSI